MNDRFAEIFDLYKNDIYRLAFSYTKNISDSDDIVQNVFVKLYRKEEILEKENSDIKKWLIRVCINECKTLLLSSWKKKISSLSEKEENIKSEMPSNDVLNAVLELPKKYRIVTYLYYYEDYKIKEIAQILKISETSIQTRLARARKQLKEILMEVWDDE